MLCVEFSIGDSLTEAIMSVLIPQFLTASLALGFGCFVWAKHPHSRPHQIFALFYASLAIWLGGQSIGVSSPQSYEQAVLWTKIIYIGVSLIPTTLYHLICSLYRLNPRFPTVRTIYLIAVVVILLSWGTPWIIDGAHKYAWGYFTAAGRFHPLFLMWFAYLCLKSTWHALTVLRSSTHSVNSRNQAGYLLAGMFIGTLGMYDYLPEYGINLQPKGYLFEFIFICLVGYAIVRHQLMDIRVVIRRGLVYSILVAGITATYLVMVMIMERWFQGFFGYRSFVATAVVAFLVAIFFDPLRSRIQALVDRVLFKATPPELAAQREQLLAEVRKGEQMKAVGTLAAGLAHEIKNPLASIKTFTEHLAQHHGDPDFREKFQKIVGGEVERINRIVQQLLEFAKPVPPKLIPVKVPQLLDETLEFLNNEFIQRKVEIQKQYLADTLVLADPQQLKQVFLNLFLNSLQAMNGHGQLQVNTVVRGSELEVTVADNGAGIGPKDLPHIFEPFFSTKSNGTGLGLSVVQGIIQEHRGRIAVQSEPGRGTSVTVRLPVTARGN